MTKSLWKLPDLMDAKNTRPQILGKLQNKFSTSFHRPVPFRTRGHFYRVKDGDISKES